MAEPIDPRLGEENASKLLSRFGLKPQTFPTEYALGPVTFTDANGNPSGAIGARATLDKTLSNFPHMIMGIRLANRWSLPAAPSDEDIAHATYIKRYIDGEQTVRMQVAQQSILIDPSLQTLVTGRDGLHWHPFPAPYPVAGGNDVSFEIVRVSAYPPLPSQPAVALEPQVFGILVCAVFRGDLRSAAPHRA